MYFSQNWQKSSCNSKRDLKKMTRPARFVWNTFKYFSSVWRQYRLPYFHATSRRASEYLIDFPINSCAKRGWGTSECVPVPIPKPRTRGFELGGSDAQTSSIIEREEDNYTVTPKHIRISNTLQYIPAYGHISVQIDLFIDPRHLETKLLHQYFLTGHKKHFTL